ncbi:hypothetical protein BBOV_II001740 [Babesia bovis T2Bo]|uniref:Uncharacterized protein n=1 Tax=Babesia bovis TaxID=5865 RepID=A7AT70_BABBO|nr:hypothetical protein BBOV_II001740 [Babesia bovis T2Bo]EDO06131.1 hypothetical protein BBOV_II001740 [Babesia bovis T2Bo]|eukprot:XP_001609699.1 hypothetical protein [Babesia bovis T2Bo]
MNKGAREYISQRFSVSSLSQICTSVSESEAEETEMHSNDRSLDNPRENRARQLSTDSEELQEDVQDFIEADDSKEPVHQDNSITMNEIAEGSEKSYISSPSINTPPSGTMPVMQRDDETSSHGSGLSIERSVASRNTHLTPRETVAGSVQSDIIASSSGAPAGDLANGSQAYQSRSISVASERSVSRHDNYEQTPSYDGDADRGSVVSSQSYVTNLSALNRESFEAMVNDPSFSSSGTVGPPNGNVSGAVSSEIPRNETPQPSGSFNDTETMVTITVQEASDTINMVATARQDSVVTDSSSRQGATRSQRTTPRQPCESVVNPTPVTVLSATPSLQESVLSGEPTTRMPTYTTNVTVRHERTLTDETVLQESISSVSISPRGVGLMGVMETNRPGHPMEGTMIDGPAGSTTASGLQYAMNSQLQGMTQGQTRSRIPTPREVPITGDRIFPPTTNSSPEQVGTPRLHIDVSRHSSLRGDTTPPTMSIVNATDQDGMYIDIGEGDSGMANNIQSGAVESGLVDPRGPLNDLVHESSGSSSNFSPEPSPDRGSVIKHMLSQDNMGAEAPYVVSNDVPEGTNVLTGQLSKEVDHYQQKNEELERKLVDIWNQKEAFRVANERIAANIRLNSGIKSVRFDESATNDSLGQGDAEGEFINKHSNLKSPPPPIYYRSATEINHKHLMKRDTSPQVSICVSSDEQTSPRNDLHTATDIPRGIPCNMQTMERLLNCGSKLYAFRLATPGVRSTIPLYMDVCTMQSTYSGKVVLTSNVGLFKVSLVKPNKDQEHSVLSYLGLDNNSYGIDYVYGLVNSIAEYVGLYWRSEEPSSQKTNVPEVDRDMIPPSVHIKYMYSLVNGADSTIMVGDGFPSNSNVSTMLNGQHEQLFCIEETRELRKTDLQNNPKFTFILDTSPSPETKQTSSKRFSSLVHIVNSATREYLCVDLLTRELRFAGGPCTKAYSKYIVPAAFKMVKLYNVLTERQGSIPGSVDEAVEYANYRRCVTERAAYRHAYGIPKNTTHMVDQFGNFVTLSQASGTPAPSPYRTPSPPDSPVSSKNCILRRNHEPQVVSNQVASMYDIADTRDFGSSESSARSQSRAVDMYNMLDNNLENLPVTSIPSAHSPRVKDLTMKFERLSSRSRMNI